MLTVAAALMGALTWSFAEYAIHRWAGHKFRRNLFAAEHIRHHSEGNYFAATYKKVAVALVAAAIVTPAAVLVAGLAPGVAYAAGFVAMYAGYEILHRREHTHPGVGPYGRWARRHHFHHHFVDPKTNHGVTSPLWDLVFGTFAVPGRTRVPARLQMHWLADPETGDVRREYAQWYTILQPRAQR